MRDAGEELLTMMREKMEFERQRQIEKLLAMPVPISSSHNHLLV